MSAYETLQAAQAAQIEVKLEGGRLELKAPRPPSQQVINLLKANKRAIMAVLRPADAPWSADNFKAYYEERLTLAERSYPRAAAELIAFYDTADWWLDVNPPQVSDPTCCCHCRKEMGAGETIGVAGANGQTGALHAECAFRWGQFQRLRARAAVSRLIG